MENDWEGEGEHCDRCNDEIFRVWRIETPARKLKLCKRCFNKFQDIWFELINCPKCKTLAVLLVVLREGLMDMRMTCRNCGTFQYVPKKDREDQSPPSA